jgi:hypothetical protein
MPYAYLPKPGVPEDHDFSATPFTGKQYKPKKVRHTYTERDQGSILFPGDDKERSYTAREHHSPYLPNELMDRYSLFYEPGPNEIAPPGGALEAAAEGGGPEMDMGMGGNENEMVLTPFLLGEQ